MLVTDLRLRLNETKAVEKCRSNIYSERSWDSTHFVCIYFKYNAIIKRTVG